jgi:2-polyprenyl-3-methyl-5-hydroxy-6-metoxy-1,4-benzoquinol methylase
LNDGGAPDGFGGEKRMKTGVKMAPNNLEFTGERIVPGATDEPLFREHEERYIFAGGFVRDKQILDVACGTGVGTHYLFTAGARGCYGLDISKGAVEYARCVYPDCEFFQGDATQIPLPDGSIDVVVSFETIEHVGNQERFLQECCRVLRPGGSFICSTPNRKMVRWHNANPFHAHELTQQEFERLLGTVFTDIQLQGQDLRTYPWYVLRTLLVRLLDQFKARELAKRILGWRPSSPSGRAEFDPSLYGTSDRQKIRSSRAGRFVEPMYLIAVGRKA